MKRALYSLGLALLLILCVNSSAEVRLPKIISDNMVLQQKSKAPVWGWAEPKEQITVQCSWRKRSIETVADEQGNWKTTIDTPAAGGPYRMKISGKNTICLSNILIGEVWVCSGQSNMEMPLLGYNYKEQQVKGGAEAIKNANYPNIRLFTVQKYDFGYEPVEDCNGLWQPCSPDTVGKFSAEAYFFGQELYKNLNIPIGLINISYGGTAAEAWMGKQAFKNDPELNVLVEKFNEIDAEYKITAAKAKAEGKPIPAHPKAPNRAQTYLYNGMIAPIIPYAIKGVFWDQGESNASDGTAYLYHKLFSAMIANWRSNWGIGNFPFYFVQAVNWAEFRPGESVTVEKGKPIDNAWSELREAQLFTMRKVKNTGMAVIIDTGVPNTPHSPNKLEVGLRIANWALAKDYGKKVHYCGPIYRKMKIENCKIRLSFDYVKGGLKAKGDKLDGFAIAGADKKFVWANAKIKGRSVVVWSDEVANPVAVRYAWAQYPFCNLFDPQGLPASPFRTDDWPMLTKKP